MLLVSWRTLRLCYCLFAVAAAACPLAAFADVIESSASHGSREVEMFAAIDAGELDVVLIPRDSKRMTLQVKNKTDKPLAVRLPHAFAGVPVLAQIGPLGGPFGGGALGGPFGGGGGGGGGAPQAVGSGFPAPGGFAPGGIMNIPAGKVVKVKRESVCLEHGKPEPGPRVEYRIARLETVSDDPAVRELLAKFAQSGGDQRIAQIAAWHLANGMTWEQLSALTIKQFNGKHRPQFSREEIAAAKKAVASLPSRQKPKEESLSRR
jgi:hypothetical protein